MIQHLLIISGANQELRKIGNEMLPGYYLRISKNRMV